MQSDFLPVNNIFIPRLLLTHEHFLLVYKPPRMHSAPLAKSKDANILAWCAEKHPEVLDLPGRKEGEGGLLHRLDFETQGLLLIARTLHGMESLLTQQEENRIIKEYTASVSERKLKLPGFQASKPVLPRQFLQAGETGTFQIKSGFRPFGPGGKVVRPLESCEKLYLTEIVKGDRQADGFISLRIRIFKGFRHQIRCHLAWLGLPILNDSLYGGACGGNGLLALRASSLSFNDPSSGDLLNFSICGLSV